jgi:hypothetical protein
LLTCHLEDAESAREREGDAAPTGDHSGCVEFDSRSKVTPEAPFSLSGFFRNRVREMLTPQEQLQIRCLLTLPFRLGVLTVEPIKGVAD